MKRKLLICKRCSRLFVIDRFWFQCLCADKMSMELGKIKFERFSIPVDCAMKMEYLILSQKGELEDEEKKNLGE